MRLADELLQVVILFLYQIVVTISRTPTRRCS